MNRYNTIVIIDWDDTLFPTSWVTKNNISVGDYKTRKKYKSLFSELDITAHNFLLNIGNHSRTILVTNASLSWFYTSLNMLPNTEAYIKSNIPVISARELHSPKFPNQPNKWKIQVYNKLIQPVITNGQLKNIISIGDGPSEFYALINLAFNNKKSIYYKTVRFLGTPNTTQLMEQISMVNKNVKNIIYKKTHIDLVFGNKNIDN